MESKQLETILNYMVQRDLGNTDVYLYLHTMLKLILLRIWNLQGIGNKVCSALHTKPLQEDRMALFTYIHSTHVQLTNTGQSWGPSLKSG